MVEDFIYLKKYSDMIFDTISQKVKDNTKFPLVKLGEFTYSNIKENGTEIMTTGATHNNNSMFFIVAFKHGLLDNLNVNKKAFNREIDYVADYLIEYIRNNYKHK
jgi:hypothetical protein